MVKAATLAHYLIELGVGPESMVGLCMDKSKWAIVAMMAILQAGGVVVPLGVSHPLARIEVIVKDTKAKIILVDQQQADRIAELAKVQLRSSHFQLITIASRLLTLLPAKHETPNTIVTPDNAAWVVYTSGSTGVPKGVILEHSALCTSMRAGGARFGMGSDTRTIQFAAHTFDAVIQDYMTLIWGGTVCIPSESDRMNDLAGVMRSMDVNFANLTSTVARLITPAEVPKLRIMVLAGEPVQAGVVEKWHENVNILNAMGPSECSINATCYGPTDPSQVPIIGFPIGSRLWVTDVTDSDRLCPIGAPGELLIEGPLLARGYLNDIERTAASFIIDPEFTKILELGLKPGRRMCRTAE